MALNLAFSKNKEESLVHAVLPFTAASLTAIILFLTREIEKDDIASTTGLLIAIAAVISLFLFISRPIEYITGYIARRIQAKHEKEKSEREREVWNRIVKPKKESVDAMGATPYAAVPPEPTAEDLEAKPTAWFHELSLRLEALEKAERIYSEECEKAEKKRLEELEKRMQNFSFLYSSPLFSHVRNRANLRAYFFLGLLWGIFVIITDKIDGFLLKDSWSDGVPFAVAIILTLVVVGWKFISGVQDMAWKLEIIDRYYNSIGWLITVHAGRYESLLTSCRLAIEIEDWKGAEAYVKMMELEVRKQVENEE